jgi:hypothetical protein
MLLLGKNEPFRTKVVCPTVDLFKRVDINLGEVFIFTTPVLIIKNQQVTNAHYIVFTYIFSDLEFYKKLNRNFAFGSVDWVLNTG